VAAVGRDQQEGILAHFGVVIKRLNNREPKPEPDWKASVVIEGNAGTVFGPNERVVTQREAEIQTATAGKTDEWNTPIVVAGERFSPPPPVSFAGSSRATAESVLAVVPSIALM